MMDIAKTLYRKSLHSMTFAEVTEFYLPYGPDVVNERIEYLRERNRARKAERKTSGFKLKTKEAKTIRDGAKYCEVCLRSFTRRGPVEVVPNLGHKVFPSCLARLVGIIPLDITNWQDNGVVMCPKCNHFIGLAEASLDRAFSLLEGAEWSKEKAVSVIWPIWLELYPILRDKVSTAILEAKIAERWDSANKAEEYQEVDQELTKVLLGLDLAMWAALEIRERMPK